MNDRVLQLGGVVNFRDFGGYQGVGGARVRSGRLFRSAHFAEAVDSDLPTLDGLGVKAVTDLRRPEERQAYPNRWPGQAVIVHANDDGQLSKPPHVAFLEQSDLTAEAVRGYMVATYTHIPFEPRYVQLFASFLRHLAQTGGPAVAHCAAGKDRTGIIVAVTHSLLGVSRDEVFADYELTNTVVDLDARLPRMREAISARYQRAVSDEAVRPMIGVHADYLNASFVEIERAHGGVEQYARAVLGLSEAEVESLRERLLV